MCRAHLAVVVALGISLLGVGCAPADSDSDSETTAQAASDAESAAAERVLAYVVDHPDAVGVAGELATVKGAKGTYRLYAVPESVVRVALAGSAAASVDSVGAAMDAEVGGHLVVGESGFVAYYAVESGAVAALGQEDELRGACQDFGVATSTSEAQGTETKGLGLRPQGLATPLVEKVVPLVQRAVRALFSSPPKVAARELPAATRVASGATEDASTAVRKSVEKLADAGEKQAALASRRPAKVVGEVGAVPGLTEQAMTTLKATVDGTIAVDRAAAKELLSSGGYKVYAGNMAHDDAAVIASRLGDTKGVWLSVGSGWLQDVRVPTRLLPNFRQVQVLGPDDAVKEAAQLAAEQPGARWATDLVVVPSEPGWLAQKMCDEFLVSINSKDSRAIEFLGGKLNSYRIYEAVHNARWRLRYQGAAPKITIVRDAGTPEGRVEEVIRNILNDRVFSPPITRDQLSITIIER